LHPTSFDTSHQETNYISSIPGLHIIANFTVADLTKLKKYQAFEQFINGQIQNFNLSKVGEVYYNFETGGYTGVICLTESHLSIHTWPEKQYLTFDIFLSNYLKDNRPVTVGIYESVKKYFDAVVVLEQIIER
jgi:S-adenosylmethionine decarboxylase